MLSRVSIAELIDGDVLLRPDEAVAIVREVCRQYDAGDLRGIPNAAVIRLTDDGAVVVEGPVSRDQSAVPAAAALLSELLPGFGSPEGFKVPGGLRLVLARATGALDVPPFAGAGDLCAALERFAAPDLPAVVRTLFQSWTARRASREPDAPSRELTISDIRRARRATGLSLEDVSRGAAIAADKLRELEWGYMRNWRADEDGRDEIRRYAHAAGLDEDLVMAVAWPLIESEGRDERSDVPVAVATTIDEPGVSLALVPAGTHALATMPRRPTARWSGSYRWAVALASAVLLVTGVVLGDLDRPAPPLPAPALPHPASPRPAAALPLSHIQPASLTQPAPAERRPAARPRARKPPKRQARQSFFEKELFRIVIR